MAIQHFAMKTSPSRVTAVTRTGQSAQDSHRDAPRSPGAGARRAVPRSALLLSMVVAVISVTTGCTDTSPGSSRPSRDTTRGKHVVPLPLDRYRPSEQQRLQLATAQHTLIGKCTSRYGLHWAVPKRAGLRFEDPYFQFGVIDEQDAVRYGFHPAPEQQDDDGDLALALQLNKLSAEERAVVEGWKGLKPRGTDGAEPITAYRDKAVLPYGCLGEAVQLLEHGTHQLNPAPGVVADMQRGGSETIASLRLSELAADAAYRTRRGLPYRDLAAKWSSCMKRSGFDSPDPESAREDPRWNPNTAPSTTEIRTAAADAKCLVATDFLRQAAALQAHDEEKMIKQNTAELQEVRDNLNARLKNATALLRSP